MVKNLMAPSLKWSGAAVRAKPVTANCSQVHDRQCSYSRRRCQKVFATCMLLRTVAKIWIQLSDKNRHFPGRDRKALPLLLAYRPSELMHQRGFGEKKSQYWLRLHRAMATRSGSGPCVLDGNKFSWCLQVSRIFSTTRDSGDLALG